MGLIGFAQSVHADSPAPNLPQQFDSANGQYYVEMIPSDNSWGGYGSGKGTAYRISSNGTVDELWSVNFYASEAMLTNDGHHLIVLGPIASSISDLAISFYQDGEEIKHYQIEELIQDQTKLSHTSSHFFWRLHHNEYRSGLSSDEKEYRLSLIDSSIYVFDVTSGQILSKKSPEHISR